MRTKLLLALVFIVVFIFSGNVFAANSPYTHINQKGDNLWNLAEKHYGKSKDTPSAKKARWNLIRRIAYVSGVKNPHWIYPGKITKFPQQEQQGSYKKVAKKHVVKNHRKISRENLSIFLIEIPRFAAIEKTTTPEDRPPETLVTAEIETVIPKVEEAKTPETAVSEKNVSDANQLSTEEKREVVVIDNSKTHGALAAAIDSIAAQGIPITRAESPTETTQYVEKTYEIPGSSSGVIPVKNLFSQEAEKAEKRKDAASPIEFNSNFGYRWSCYEQFGECQGAYFIGDVTLPLNKWHRLGLEVGFEWINVKLIDSDSKLKGDEKGYKGGVVYKYLSDKKLQIIIKNGLELKKIEDNISSLGGEVNFQRRQKDLLFYTVLDLQKEFEKWRLGLGFEFKSPLMSEFSSDLPGNSKLNNEMLTVSVRLQRKVFSETYLGVEIKPYVHSKRIGFDGASAAFTMEHRVNDWLEVKLKAGWLFYPYSFSEAAITQGATIGNTGSPDLGFDVRLLF